MKKSQIILFVLGSILVVCLGIKVSHHMPPNAIVYVDDDKGIYYGYPTVQYYRQLIKKHKPIPEKITDDFEYNFMKDKYNGLVETTAKQARARGFEPDPESKDNGDFTSEECSLIYYALEEIGILPSTSRWNDDGTWRY